MRVTPLENRYNRPLERDVTGWCLRVDGHVVLGISGVRCAVDGHHGMLRNDLGNAAAGGLGQAAGGHVTINLEQIK